MTAPEYFVYDGDPGDAIVPRRPTIDDVGGAEFINDEPAPPDPQLFPNAFDENQQEKLVVGLCQVSPVCVLEVRFSGGAPDIYALAAVGQSILESTFTVVDNSAGDTSITWPADTFPSGLLRFGWLTIVEDVEIDRARAVPITNGVRVKTKLGAVGTDAAFSIAIFAQ